MSFFPRTSATHFRTKPNAILRVSSAMLAENEEVLPPYGQRLLPQVVDQLAEDAPDRIYASYPLSTDLSGGFIDVNYRCLSQAVSKAAWTIDLLLGKSVNFDTICYVGIADIRYAIFFLASIKCGFKLLLLSPRNRPGQNASILSRTACRAIWFSAELDQLVSVLLGVYMEIDPYRTPILTMQSPALEDFLSMTEDVVHYSYDKHFHAAINDPVLVLHSSGSTGDPKFVQLTNGALATVDNQRRIPVPSGRDAQGLRLFEFGRGGGPFYSPFPPYHLAGVNSYVMVPIFSSATSVVLGHPRSIPSGVLVSQLMRVRPDLRAMYLAPAMIEQWIAEPDGLAQAKNLEFLVFGGGQLAPAIGDKLQKVLRLCQTYGSLEIAGLSLLVPREDEWSYIEFNPYEEHEMQEFDDGLFELVLIQTPRSAWMRALSHNFPDVKEWRTRDLFRRHPTKPNLWKFESRVDDLIVMSNGLKIQPGPLELIIQGSSYVTAALITGQGRAAPILILELSPQADITDDDEVLLDIFDVVEEANSMAPTYGQISQSHIIIAPSDRKFIRAPKGTVIRALTASLFAEEIDEIFADDYVDDSTPKNNGPVDFPFSSISPEIIRNLVRETVKGYTRDVTDDESLDDENLFMLGFDSLRLAQLAMRLRKDLPTPNHGTRIDIPLRLVHRYPTVNSLSEAIYCQYSRPELVDERPIQDIATMKRLIDEGIADLTRPERPRSSLPETGLEVLMLGPRGSLGPSIIRSLLSNPKISKIHCLNRSSNGREQLRSIFDERNFSHDFDDSRLEFYSVDIASPRLGLSESQWSHLQSKVHITLHNAWKVDFSVPLAYYELEYIQSVRSLIDFCAASSLGAGIVFCSSISSVQDWAHVYGAELVPERPLAENELNVSSPQGYGQSKHVSERILVQAGAKCDFPVTVLRIGQVAGSTEQTGVAWSETEWIPALVKISCAIGSVPVDLPNVDWIPSDTVSRVISEIATRDAIQNSVDVFNLVNKHKIPATDFFDVVSAQAKQELKRVKMAGWVQQLVDIMGTTKSQQTVMEDGGEESRHTETAELHVLIAKLLPWFQYLSDTISGGNLIQPDFDVAKVEKISPTMAALQPISKDLMAFWCSQWGLAPRE